MIAAKELLENRGVHPSVQRIAIMKYLMEHCTHPTVDTIYTDLLPSLPTLSRTTVYNTLQLFCDANAARAITIDKRNVRYEYCDSAHAHFLCTKCGRVFDVDISDRLNSSLYHDERFKVENVELNFVGICSECTNREEPLAQEHKT
ncbi:MAG: Fur family transcriptional regulator [Sodaliphilus sp.]